MQSTANIKISNPFFSIILPLHNKADYFSYALQSIYEQTYQDFELIIVDDASTDEGIKKLENFQELSQKTRILKRNYPGAGGYAARNMAAKNARGQFLAFLDADDLWLPNHLECTKRLLSKEIDIAFLCTAFEEIYGNERKLISLPKDSLLSQSQFLYLYSKKDIIHTNSIIIPLKNFLLVGGFPEKGVKRGGDHLLWLRLALTGGPIIISSTKTSIYCRDNSNVVGKIDNIKGVHPILKEVCNIINSNQITSTKDKLLLQRLANRKQLHWSLHKTKAGLNSRKDINLIFLKALGFYGWLKIMLLYLPAGILKRLFNIRNKLKNELINAN